MNMNLARAVVVALSSVLIPNVAGAYYAAHMGRFTSRDPFGEVVRMGMAMEAPLNHATNMGFLRRDQYDPTVDYHDGMNLYQYVQSHPTIDRDPMGLHGAGKCGDRWVYLGSMYGCCSGKVFNHQNHTLCCNNGVVGPCPPPPPLSPIEQAEEENIHQSGSVTCGWIGLAGRCFGGNRGAGFFA